MCVPQVALLVRGGRTDERGTSLASTIATRGRVAPMHAAPEPVKPGSGYDASRDSKHSTHSRQGRASTAGTACARPARRHRRGPTLDCPPCAAVLASAQEPNKGSTDVSSCP